MIIAFILLIFGIILFTPIRLFVTYKDNVFELKLGFGRIKIKFPFFKKKGDAEGEGKKQEKKTDDFNRFQKFFAIIQTFYDTSALIRKSIILEKIDIKADFGSVDAAFTGMAVGLAYAEIYKLIGFFATIFTVNPPDIIITPVFEDKSVFRITAEGIIKTKAAHIIFTIIIFFVRYKKAIKGKD